ncbi:hypothetical protein CHRY9390_01633 [Chryseobacterium aquaeductus]|uniref:Uncharacterized protein n=1 Tax=Chryseobacterium aquaeductus TaxID=2675056 RepID=A0A9N8MFR5_9FLAO|nr:hypothetical protein [Chryseobacterium aquaeductus]CAA7330954.1 hypothetical protein CHRY9390_01633 [Chryseobacterium potabilaquae]CAD7807256.1 hypothetical protein CHRY9390_01633 [Chryseobacterium aquaeductus]
MGKIVAGFERWIFPQIHISVLLIAKFSFGDVPKAMAHFSLFGLGSVGKKGIFGCWLAVDGCWQLRWRKRALPVARKAFCIISHYRQRWCWFASNEASAEWKATVLRWQFAYNVDYVICCGIKALGKLRTSFGGKCLFLAVGRDIIQNASGRSPTSIFLLDWMILIDCCL